MPQTTILLPSYNCAKYISLAIESILLQQYNDYELLIIDDGSTDNTFEVIKTFKDDRVRYIKNDTNLGIVKSLNKGIALSKSEYIARMDADDIMLGNMVNLLSQELDLYNIPHTIHELTLHAAVCFGYGKYYFNNPEKVSRVTEWFNKIYNSKSITSTYDECFLKKHRASIRLRKFTI